MKDRLNLIRLHSSANLKQGAHIQQPTAGPVLYACVQPCRAVSGSHRQLFHPYWDHQPDKAFGLINAENPRLKNPLLSRWVQRSLSSAISTQQMWELLAGNRTAVLPRHPGVRWITSYQWIKARGTHTPTHGLAITSRMCRAISHGQWHPWTAVSPLLRLISMA